MSFRIILYSSLLLLTTLTVVQGTKHSFREKHPSRQKRAAPRFNQSTYSFSPKNCSAGAYIGQVNAGGGDVTYYLNNANNVQIDPQTGVLKLWNDLYTMTVIVANARSSNGAVNSAPVTITPSCSYSSNSYSYGYSPYGYQPQPYAPYPYGPSYNPYAYGYAGANAGSGTYISATNTANNNNNANVNNNGMTGGTAISQANANAISNTISNNGGNAGCHGSQCGYNPGYAPYYQQGYPPQSQQPRAMCNSVGSCVYY